MNVALLEMVIDSNLPQPLNATCPMLITLSGIIMELKELHPEYLEVIDSQLFAVNTVEK